MKPEILKLYNIGPFVGEHEIDFSQLDDIFLISGKTGSGKTTILDAITYVLYGNLPGARKNIDTKNLRSHFCNENDTSYVDFVFSLNSKFYRVKRTLPYIYTTRNNTKRKEAETTELYELKDRYDKIGNIISNQKTEADGKIIDYIHLTLDEFSKIILLPQGEFANFLRQNSTERKGMLSKLFPVDIFTNIIQYTKDENKKLATQYEQITKRLDFIKKDFNINTYEEKINELTTNSKKNENEIEIKQNRLYEIVGTLEKLQQEISDYNEYENLKSELEKILSNKDKIEELKIKNSKAKKSLELFPLVSNLEKKEKLIKETQTNLSICEKTIVDLLNTEKLLKEREKTISQTENEITKLEIKKNELEQSFTTLISLKENKDELEKTNLKIKQETEKSKSTKEEIQQIKNFLEENKSKLEQKESLLNEIFILDKNLKTVENNNKYLEETKKDEVNKIQEEKTKEQISKQKLLIEDLENEINNDKLNELAHTLSCSLKENEPCPVCGSTNHPNLAKKNSNNISKQDNLDLQKKLLNETEEKLSEIIRIRNVSEGTILSLKDTIDLSIQETKDEIQNSINEKSQAINFLKELESKIQIENKKLLQTEEIFNNISEKLNSLLQNKKLFEDRIKNTEDNLIKNFSFTEIELSNIVEIENKLQLEFTNTKDKIDSSKQIVEIFYKEQKQNSIDLSTQQEKKSNLNEILLTNQNEYKTESEILKDKISKSNFSSIEEIKNNYLDEEQILTFEKQIEQWKNEKTRLETLITEKQNSFSAPIEELSTKFNLYQNENLQLRNQVQQLSAENIEITKKISELKKSKENYDKEEKDQKEIKEKLNEYSKLYDVISGTNDKKIDITSWILEMYLQEIIEFANIRLRKISDERYIMKVNTEKESNRGAKGLDIDIYDSFTGKTRPCNSLSGGETFMASISLALAISDTIQSRKSGINIDSLFIDEGFGSLDENSLEQAISILDEIRDSRMIGIISHVGDLKSRINSNIEIIKTQHGSKLG